MESRMNTISEFFGIIIKMGDDKAFPIPYIQVSYEQKKATFSIETGEMMEVLGGGLDDFPYKERCLVTGWLTIHKDALLRHWEDLKQNPNCMPRNIYPLK